MRICCNFFFFLMNQQVLLIDQLSNTTKAIAKQGPRHLETPQSCNTPTQRTKSAKQKQLITNKTQLLPQNQENKTDTNQADQSQNTKQQLQAQIRKEQQTE
jgi:hypothetical protein